MAALDDYPSPHVAVDIAVLTVADFGTPGAHLAARVLERSDSPTGLVVPGRFLRPDETIRSCIRTALNEKAGVSTDEVEPRLLHVFDDPDRDPRGWTVSLSHVVVLPPRVVTGRLESVDNLPPMLFDHDVIVAAAAADVRERYEAGPDPDGLLDAPFTLSELRVHHESVLGERLRRDTFRRRMESLLVPIAHGNSQAVRSDGGRPARLWRTADQSINHRGPQLPRDTSQTTRLEKS